MSDCVMKPSSLTLSASSPSLSPSLPQILHLPSAKTRLPIPQKSNSLKPSYLNSFPRQNKSKSIRIFFTVRSSKSSTIEYDVGTASTQFQNVNVSTESKNEFNVEEVRSPIVPSNLSPPKLSLGDQAFFLLALIACTTSAAFVGFVVAAVPTLFAMGRAAIALSKLADTASKELPGTMAAIRLSGMEISDLTLELSDLSHEIADGVSKSTQAVQAADAGIRQIGSLAREQTMLMIHERANLPDISLQPVVAGAAKKTSRAVGRAARTFMNIISRRKFSSENEDRSILDSLEV